VEHMGIDKLLRMSILTALVGAVIFASPLSGPISPLSLALIGLGLAPIYPCMMTRTPDRLGRAVAAHAIGFQVSAAMLGAAALPSLSGFLAQGFGLESVAIAAITMATVICLLHERILRISTVQSA
jgi:fucose permease